MHGQRVNEIPQTQFAGDPSNTVKKIRRYKRLDMDVMRQSACLVVNPIMVYSYGLLFNFTKMGQTSLNKGPDVKLNSLDWCL